MYKTAGVNSGKYFLAALQKNKNEVAQVRRTKYTGSFFIMLLFNILINIEWSLPAWILLILHFVIGLSIWWFVAALALWIVFILLWMLVIGAAAKCGSEPAPYRENKNPYSAGKYGSNAKKDGSAGKSGEQADNQG